MPRPTPYDLLFSPIAADRFPPLRTSIESAGVDPRDRDAFLMTREAIQLVRELRPEGGVGEAIDQLVALVHHAYLFWAAGMPVMEVGAEALGQLLAERDPNGGEPGPGARYVQLPELRVWAEVVEGEPHEPMDGFFAHGAGDGALRVLGVFGVHPSREGFTVVEAAGARAGELARADGSPLFASRLPGGGRAGLHSIVGGEELVELGWRAGGVGS